MSTVYLVCVKQNKPNILSEYIQSLFSIEFHVEKERKKEVLNKVVCRH